jgi:D-psicose/D-tagatose/L-ribulose 3-epimerase
MPKYGVHAFLLEGSWNSEIAPRVIAQAAELGFDFVEIPLLRPDEFDSALIGNELARNRIEGVTSLCLPRELHMPVNPKGALQFLKSAVDRIADFGGKSLYGCTYCNLGFLTGAPPTAEEKKSVADTLRELHAYAKQKGVQIAIEPVNRYETYLCNTGADAADYIRQIGADDIIIHFDTYHMNIEEEGYSGPLKAAGPLCGYIHLSESNRGLPGEGMVDWKDVFDGLKAINYTGPLVLEAFAAINPDLVGATCLWHPSKYTPKELAVRGLEFLKENAAKAGLA